MKTFGYALIALGLIALIYGGFTYSGEAQAHPAKSVTVHLSLAGIAVLAGAMLVFSGRRPA